jgi:hypothetical protein
LESFSLVAKFTQDNTLPGKDLDDSWGRRWRVGLAFAYDESHSAAQAWESVRFEEPAFPRNINEYRVLGFASKQQWISTLREEFILVRHQE